MEEEGLRGGVEGARTSQQKQMAKQMTEALGARAMMQLPAPTFLLVGQPEDQNIPTSVC